jgi:hypothetical protein
VTVFYGDPSGTVCGMRRTRIALFAVLLSAVAPALSGCGADGESRPPTTTVYDETVLTEKGTDAGDEVERKQDDGDEGDDDSDKGEEKDKEKDRGKGQGKGRDR